MLRQQAPFIHCKKAAVRLQVWVWCLVAALLTAQMLGQLHAVHHGGAGHAPAAFAVHEAHDAHEAHEAHHDAGVLHVLFSPHQNEKECRLYDQLRDVCAAPGVAAIFLPRAAPGLAVAIFQGNALARWAALFDARGPPLAV